MIGTPDKMSGHHCILQMAKYWFRPCTFFKLHQMSCCGHKRCATCNPSTLVLIRRYT
ncbi:hypothetical protein L3Q82_018106 [Scortum barcoo]|uniref:Uncharacterized protein n=1 Tax=Scortum barcoo TaxID=214431 RepID=A0ACB8VHZ2_9TELE|nr:hypothetical protein L3Q82_018106 [Scortum barcoo]